MYIPKLFAETDEDSLLAFMREFNFATVVTCDGGVPTATHIPLIVEKRGGEIVISGHVAKANDHWKQFADRPVLSIFQEPHAYISPSLYVEKLNVPTWNYVAVHAYGSTRIFNEPGEKLALLEKMIQTFDAKYFTNQWPEIPDEYKLRQAAAIVAFEISVTDLQGKKKLNQNKGIEDAKNVIGKFEQSDNAQEKLIARFMKEEIYGDKKP